MKGINRIDSSTRLWASAKAPNSNWGLGFVVSHVGFGLRIVLLELPFSIMYNFPVVYRYRFPRGRSSSVSAATCYLKRIIWCCCPFRLSLRR